jgi:hypothetical protein
MSDPDHEGHRGKIIDEISDLASIGISAAPNIVLLHAGTNDMNKDVDTGNAPARLKKLIDKILKVSPKAVILVSAGSVNQSPDNAATHRSFQCCYPRTCA